MSERINRCASHLRFRRNGKTYVRYAGADLRTAEAFAAKLHFTIEQEELLGRKAIPAVTLPEIQKTFFAHLEARHSPTNVASEKLQFGVLSRMLGKTAIRDIDRGTVEDLMTRLRIDHGVKTSTVNRYLTLLSAIFKFALVRDYCRENPVQGMRREREEMRPVPYISEADVRKLVAAARHPEMAHLVRILSDTGLRRGEALDLEWQDIDLARGVLVVRKSKTRTPREVPLTSACADAIRAQAALLNVMPLHGRGTIWKRFSEVYRDATTRRFTTVAKRAGLPGLHLHDLRHGFACRLREAGVAIQVIAQLCGHKSITTTMRYSRHMATETLRNAIAALERGGQPPVDPGGHPASAEDASSRAETGT
ncbi:MAG: site-specific integrase [Planctomycetes bacterium]|nr:site-specific integrase [Planctomycetota bacterium]